MFDVASGTERRLNVQAVSVSGTPAWSADSDRVLLLAERHPPSPSFTSILVQSVTAENADLHPDTQRSFRQSRAMVA